MEPQAEGLAQGRRDGQHGFAEGFDDGGPVAGELGHQVAVGEVV